MTKTKHILVAEDELLIGVVLQKQLRKLGLSVSLAKNREGVFEEIARQQPDVIIMDYYLRKSNGVEIAREIRSQEMNMPVIFTTGGRRSDMEKETSDIANSTFLIKPVPFPDILNLLTSFGVID